MFLLDRPSGLVTEVPALPHLADVRELLAHLTCVVLPYPSARDTARDGLVQLLTRAEHLAQHELVAHPARCVAADRDLRATYETALSIAARWHLVPTHEGGAA